MYGIARNSRDGGERHERQRLQLAGTLVAVLGWAATASAVPIGFSWDSPGPCSAPTIVMGTPCVLNAKARVAAAAAGNAIDALDLFERAVTDGLLGRQAGTYDFKLAAEFTDDWAVGEFGWFDVGRRPPASSSPRVR